MRPREAEQFQAREFNLIKDITNAQEKKKKKKKKKESGKTKADQPQEKHLDCC